MFVKAIRDLTLGVLRYQPVQMQQFFGRDNTYTGAIMVEIAVLQVLGEIGVIPAKVMKYLDKAAIELLLDITTTEVEEIERNRTKHDVRALVQAMKKRLHPELAKWVHLMLTSYDPLDSGRIYQYLQAYRQGLRPALVLFIRELAAMVVRFAKTRQVGRTHGQHALPITVGFWLATILYRVVFNAKMMDQFSNALGG